MDVRNTPQTPVTDVALADITEPRQDSWHIRASTDENFDDVLTPD
jgi:hypothetical protein